MKLFVCTSCTSHSQTLAECLRQAMPETVETHDIDCMSGCTRAQTIAFRAPGKTAYLFGDISESDLPDLLTFARHYAASPDGNFTDARVLGDLRAKAIARIPA